jgi:hypothetical protein
MSDPTPSRPPDVETAIDNLFVRLTQMTDQDLRRIRLAWDAQDAHHRADLWRRALRLIKESDREELLAASRDRLAAWANDFASGRTGTPEDASWDVDRLNARTAAVPAVLDAVAAFAAGEGLEDAERSFLTDPFRAGSPQPSRGRSGRAARIRRASDKATS